MGYPRTMGAGLAGSTTKIYGNANVNQIQYGDKLQGLPPVTGRRDPYRVYKTKAGGNAPDRFRVFCINQLGGIGMANKNSQFAPNADGLGWCPNRKNSRQGDIGINIVDRGHDAIRFQSRADFKAEFEVIEERHESHKKTEPYSINGYYPLYSTELAASAASSTGTSHIHMLGGELHFMPNGLDQPHHGTYNSSLVTVGQKAMGNTVLYLAQLYEEENSSGIGQENMLLIEGLGCQSQPKRKCNEVTDVSGNKINVPDLANYFSNPNKPNESKFIGYYVQKTSGMMLSWDYKNLAPYQAIKPWPTCSGSWSAPNVSTDGVKPAIDSWVTSLQLPDDNSISTAIGITFTGLNPTTKDSTDIQAMFPPPGETFQAEAVSGPPAWPYVTSSDPSDNTCKGQYVTGGGDLTARIPYPQTAPNATKYLCIGGSQTKWKLSDFETIISNLDKITEKYYDGICLDIECLGAVNAGSNNIYDDLNTGLLKLLDACENNKLDVMVTISYFNLAAAPAWRWSDLQVDTPAYNSALTLLKTLTNQNDAITKGAVKYLSPQLYQNETDPISANLGWGDVVEAAQDIYKTAKNLAPSYGRPYTAECLEKIETDIIIGYWKLKKPVGWFQYHNTNNLSGGNPFMPSAPKPVSDTNCDNPAPAPAPGPSGGGSCTLPNGGGTGSCTTAIQWDNTLKTNVCDSDRKPVKSWCPDGTACCPNVGGSTQNYLDAQSSSCTKVTPSDKTYYGGFDGNHNFVDTTSGTTLCCEGGYWGNFGLNPPSAQCVASSQ